MSHLGSLCFLKREKCGVQHQRVVYMVDFDVIVIGAGPAGCMSAIQASKNGHKVLIIERNEKIGKKLYITGKGRCNLTNDSCLQTHLDNIINGKKFMYSSLNAFSPNDLMEFFSSRGLNLKVERGNRVFPTSDKSSDVIKVLSQELIKLNVEIAFNTKVESVKKINNIFHIKCEGGISYTSNCVIIATGGKSYVTTGSDGIGYVLATSFNHSIVEPMPALIPLILNEDVLSLEGLSLKNVTASIEINGKIVASEFGEMLFTNEGVSGPIVLTMSSKINRLDLTQAKFIIDFKPSLDKQTLTNRLIRDFELNPKMQLKTYLKTLLPMSFIPYFVKKLNVEDIRLCEINKNLRETIISLLKRFDFSIKSLDTINKAIITSGGVSTKEINPKTMESKLVDNLYFAGEILDVDALTGGFNLQIAFSTGYLAGSNITRLK